MSYAEDQDWFGLEDLIIEEQGIEYINIPAWRTKDGTLIAIKDMSISHIRNCIQMIYRSKGTWRAQYLEPLKDELYRRQ